MECVCHQPEFTIRGFEPSCESSHVLFSFHTCDLGHPLQQATVLLSANVGFLVVNSVNNGNGVSLRQITSYLSLMASFASIMLGLVFARHNRTESQDSGFTAVRTYISFRASCHRYNPA